MKSFVLAVAVLTVIAVGTSVLLNSAFQMNADQAYATQAARVERTL